MKILAAILLIACAYAGISIATVLKNGVSLMDTPGIIPRLKIFLSKHRAETTSNAIFPELETPIYRASVNDVMTIVEHVAKKRGWSTAQESQSSHTEKNTLHFIVTTALMRFKDDIAITVESIDTNRVTVHIRSESRVGKADFGANLSHVTKLISELDLQLEK